VEGFEGRAEASALPGYFRHNLFRYCQGIIYFDSKISDRAFGLGMPEQKLNGPLAPAGIDSFRIAREVFKKLEIGEGGRTIILIGLFRRRR